MPRLISGANEFLGPKRPFFMVRGSASWTEVSSGAAQIMQLGTVVHNIGGHYSTSTYKFTAPVNGTYQFNHMGYFRNKDSDDDSDYYYWHFNIGGTGYGSSIDGYTNAGDSDMGVGASITKYLVAGTTAHVECGASSTGPDYYGTHNVFSGFLVG